MRIIPPGHYKFLIPRIVKNFFEVFLHLKANHTVFYEGIIVNDEFGGTLGTLQLFFLQMPANSRFMGHLFGSSYDRLSAKRISPI